MLLQFDAPSRTVADPDALARAVFSELVRIADGFELAVVVSSRPSEEHDADAFFVRATSDAPAHIVVDDALRPLPAARALAHELAHAILHAEASSATEAQQEIEAELVAFALLRFMGLDTLGPSLDYVSRWATCDADVHHAQPRVTEACGAILARRLPRAF